MSILKTKAGKQLVAKVGMKKAKKLIRQDMISKMVSYMERQGLSTGRAQRTRQTRELLTRPTVGIDNNIRYADLSKKNPRLMGESLGAPMKQKRAERVMKIYRKRLSSKSRDGRSFNTGDFDKAFRSSQIRKGKGPKVRIPTSPEGGAKNPENIRTFFGVDRPSTPEQGEEGIMGTIRANISAEMKRRVNSDSSNKKISDKGKREQKLAKILSSQGFRRSGKALRRSKPNQ